MRFVAKVNAFELSPAESCFPFTRISVVESFIFQCEPENMIISIVITNKEMQRDSPKFKRSVQAKFSTDTSQQNVLGDVTVFQNSQ